MSTNHSTSPPQRSDAPATQQQGRKTIEERFADVTAKMGTLDLSIDPTDPSSLVKAKVQLDDIIGDLEFFVQDSLLQDTSEKSHASLGDVTELLSQTRVLRGHIAKQTSSQAPTGDAPRTASATTSTSTNSNTSSPARTAAASAVIKPSPPTANGNANGNGDDTGEPLRRDEVAKLLLLVSRAYGIKQITASQRGFLKSEIVRRSSALRKVVLQDDIGRVLTMLADLAEGK